jgi:hypothetical protein
MHKNIVCESSLRRLLCTLKTWKPKRKVCSAPPACLLQWTTQCWHLNFTAKTGGISVWRKTLSANTFCVIFYRLWNHSARKKYVQCTTCLSATMDNTMRVTEIHNKTLWCRRMHKNIVCERSLQKLLCALKTCCLKEMYVVHHLPACYNRKHNSGTWNLQQNIVVSPYGEKTLFANVLCWSCCALWKHSGQKKGL